MLLQGIYVYLKPEEGFNTSCPYRAIETFDRIISDIVGEEMMQRFLICPKCLHKGSERYFGTRGETLGPEFQIFNDMDQCASIVPEEGTVMKRHSIADTHQIMLKKAPKKIFSLYAFLRDGIEKIEKKPFKELQPTLKVGDQVWIYRDRKAKVPFFGTEFPNCVSRIMPYAHVVVYVGDNEVVHVAKSKKCCAGVMMGTIKKVPIGEEISDDDQGNFIQILFLK